MNFNNYQEMAARTDRIQKADTEEQLKEMLTNVALGVCGESGEFADIVKKVYYQGHELTYDLEQKMIDELGDQLWYIAKAARALDISLESIAKRNIEKLNSNNTSIYGYGSKVHL